MMLATMGGAGYYSKLRQVFKTNLLAYFPLNEPSGNDINEKVAARNGTSANLTRNAVGYKGSASTWGATSYANIYTAASQLNVNEGSIMLWVKMSKILWANATTYKIVDLRWTGVLDELIISKHGATKALRVGITRNGVSKYEDLSCPYNDNWMNICFTWSTVANKIVGYINGVKFWENYNTTAIGTHSGAALRSDLSGLGSGYGTQAENSFIGDICHTALLTKAATETELQALLNFDQIIFVGDSRTAYKTWPVAAITDNIVSPRNAGVAGYTLVDMLNTTVPAISSKIRPGKRNVIIIWGGVNDSAANAATIYSRLSKLATACKNLGAEVYCCTEIDGQDATRLTNSWPTKYLELNVLIKNNYSFCDGLIDLGSNVNLQNANNTTYFVDKLHLTLEGYIEVANTAAPVINQIFS